LEQGEQSDAPNLKERTQIKLTNPPEEGKKGAKGGCC